jgi:hypothetical protein
VALTAVLAAVTVMTNGVSASALRSLAVSTVQAATTRVATGKTANAGLDSAKVTASPEKVHKTMLSQGVLNLNREVNRTMYLTKCKLLAACLLAGCLVAGVCWSLCQPLPAAKARMAADEPAKVERIFW